MNKLILDTAQRKELRAQAHHLDPVVMIGSDGLTKAVLKETDVSLSAHGLIKVRVLGDDREERIQMAEKLCEQLGAGLVQHIGKLLVLYRPQPEKIHEPDDNRKPGPRIVRIVKPSKSANHRPTVKKVRLLGNQRVAEGGQIKRKRVMQRSTKKAG